MNSQKATTMKLALFVLLALQQIELNLGEDNVRPARLQAKKVEIVKANDYLEGTATYDGDYQYLKSLKSVKLIDEEHNFTVWYNIEFRGSTWKGGGMNLCERDETFLGGTMVYAMRGFVAMENRCPLAHEGSGSSVRDFSVRVMYLPKAEDGSIPSGEFLFSLNLVDENYDRVVAVRGNGTLQRSS